VAVAAAAVAAAAVAVAMAAAASEEDTARSQVDVVDVVAAIGTHLRRRTFDRQRPGRPKLPLRYRKGRCNSPSLSRIPFHIPRTLPFDHRCCTHSTTRRL
tara:strand:+ start:1293 stop:1592 length:300 start_codon:yes stop_codon:yes gene_type:complete